MAHGSFSKMTDELFPQQEWNGAPLEDVQALFDFWKTTFNKRASTVLDDKRKDKLATALRHYGMDTCKHAILGCSMSDFHMGNNNRNKVYNDLTLIFRNAEKVEAFVEVYEQQTATLHDLDQWLNS